MVIPHITNMEYAQSGFARKKNQQPLISWSQQKKVSWQNSDSLIFELQHSHENGSKWAQKPSSQRPKWLAILDVHHSPKERGFISLCCLESIDQLHPITENSNHTPNLKYTRWSIIPSSWRMIISNILNSITPDNHRPPFLNHIYI